MTDLERLTEALPTYTNMVLLRTEVMRVLSPNGVKALAQMERAALAHRDLLANGERVDFCIPHRCVSTHPGRCAWGRPDSPCCIVPKLLVDPTTEEPIVCGCGKDVEEH